MLELPLGESFRFPSLLSLALLHQVGLSHALRVNIAQTGGSFGSTFFLAKIPVGMVMSGGETSGGRGCCISQGLPVEFPR